VLGNFGSIMTGVESAINLAGQAFRTFAGFAMEGLEAVASYERLSLALTTLNASQLLQAGAAKDMASAMDVSAVKAEELLGWMQDLAIHSPFTLDGVAQAFRLAMAYGFTADEAQRLTQAFIDFSAGTGASEYNMQLIARAMGQISTAGKLMGQDMLQLTSAGLPVAQILAEAFGVSTEEIIKMREDGLLPAAEVIEALTVYMETNFKGAADNFSSSWAGLMGTFEDLKQMGLREFFGGLFDVLQPLAVELSEWLQGEGLDKLREWGDMLGQFTQTAINQIPVVIAKIEELKAAFDTGGVPALFDALFGKIDEQVIIDWLDTVDAQLATAVEFHDWTSSGDAFGAALAQFIQGDGLQSADSELIPALTDALNRWLLGAVGAASWDQWAAAAGANLSNALNEFFRIDEIANAWEEIWSDVRHGMMLGLNFDSMKFNIKNFIDNVIAYFKQLLGIASPSTVFMEIGRNIVLGLMSGILSMFPSLTSVVSTLFNLLTGGNSGRTGGATGDATGLLGGGSGTIGGGGTSGVLAGGTVTNIYNFYGTTYVSGAGPAGTYDCAPTISSGGMIPAGVR
jgi:tape measure domain-containing protein